MPDAGANDKQQPTPENTTLFQGRSIKNSLSCNSFPCWLDRFVRLWMEHAKGTYHLARTTRTKSWRLAYHPSKEPLEEAWESHSGLEGDWDLECLGRLYTIVSVLVVVNKLTFLPLLCAQIPPVIFWLSQPILLRNSIADDIPPSPWSFLIHIYLPLRTFRPAKPATRKEQAMTFTSKSHHLLHFGLR